MGRRWRELGAFGKRLPGVCAGSWMALGLLRGGAPSIPPSPIRDMCENLGELNHSGFTSMFLPVPSTSLSFQQFQLLYSFVFCNFHMLVKFVLSRRSDRTPFAGQGHQVSVLGQCTDAI